MRPRACRPAPARAVLLSPGLTLLADENGPRVVAVLGEAGSGKSCVLLEFTESLLESGTPFLPIRLDTRRPKTSSAAFGRDVCGLPEAPGLCLHAVAGTAQSVLILDQLDAIRWTAGHGFAEWEACKESIRDALLFPNVRVVVACRAFDWKTDPQIDAWRKEVSCRELSVPVLSGEEVREALEGLGFDYAHLSGSQKRMLQSPLALSLWSKLKSDGADPSSLRSTSELVGAYWRDRLEKIDTAGGSAVTTVAAVDALVDYMDREERLDAPKSLLEDDPKTLELLVSNGILGISEKRLRFVHQSLLDYRLARRVLDSISASGRPLGEWLVAGEQPLFRREQLRLGFGLLSAVRFRDCRLAGRS